MFNLKCRNIKFSREFFPFVCFYSKINHSSNYCFKRKSQMVNKNSDQSEPVKFLYILITRIQVNDDDNHLY